MKNYIKNFISISDEKKTKELFKIIDNLEEDKLKKLYENILDIEKRLGNKLFLINDLCINSLSDNITIKLALDLN